MDCIYSNPVLGDLTPYASGSATPSAVWNFQTSNCMLTTSQSASLSATIDSVNVSMHNFIFTLFICLAILIFIASFWIGQWIFNR